MGAAVNPLPGGDIVPALDRGLIDAAEFNNASSDRLLGFPDVAKNCMLQSFHQSGEQFEILFNKGKYDALPAELKHIIDYAVQAASADMSWKAIDRNRKDYIELKKAGVNFYKTPDAILRASSRPGTRSSPRSRPRTRCSRRCSTARRPSRSAPGQWQNDYTGRLQDGLEPLLRPQVNRRGLAAMTAGRQPGAPLFVCARRRAMQRWLLSGGPLSTWLGQAFAWVDRRS